MGDIDVHAAFTDLSSLEKAQANMGSKYYDHKVIQQSGTSFVENSPPTLANCVNNDLGNDAVDLDSANPVNNIPELRDDEDNQNNGHKDAHNKSHESIESQRTILEADDFASFLAEDDDDERDDFKDEDIDFDAGEYGGVDLSVLMKEGSNPYMLDFTSRLRTDSEVEGNDDYEDGDDTLSDNDADGYQYAQPPGTDSNFKNTSSWVKKTAHIHQSNIEKEREHKADDDEEFESPPRNLREEINNNVLMYSRGPILSPASTIPSNTGNYQSINSNSGTGSPGLYKYFTQSNTTPPSSPLSSKPQTPTRNPQFFSPSMTTPLTPQELPHKFYPDSQSSPKLRRSSHEKSFDHEWSKNSMTHHDGAIMYLNSQMANPHFINNEFHRRNSQPSPVGNQPMYLQTFTSESPLGHSATSSSSMENLSSGQKADSFLPRSAYASNMSDRSMWESSPLQRGKSLPDIANLTSGTYLELCKNCGFARNDYLFKIRLLQTQLEKAEKELKKKDKQWAADLGELRRENDRQQKVINQSLTLGPEAKIEATMQHEITRLTSENLDLRESIDKQSDQVRKLKKLLKVYAKKLKDGEVAEIAAELENEENAAANGDALATIIHRERSYMGMLEYKKDDEPALVKNLILDLKPKLASGLIPGLPAYILFMCVRHTDYINDDEKIKSLLTSTINGIKKVVKRHSDDLERITMWLANTCRLLHTLKQYSGEKQFQTENSPKQNEQSLRNFDLSEYRQVFSDLAVWNYQALIKLMEELIQPNVVPAILEHDAIAGLTASKPSGLRGRASSNARDIEEGRSSQHCLDALMRTLNSYIKIMRQHAVDPELIKQIFRQLFYFLCASALNNLLLRKDMCNWSKGMQIRYNLTHLEQWLRDNSLHEFGALAALEPVIQASQLLQARKTDSDVDSICDMCSKLSTAQIVKILNIYTPVDEFEERVPIAFIRKIQARLKQRDEQGTSSTTLLMDTKYSYPVTFPFNPSSVVLESISVPEELHLGFLIRH